MQHYGRNTYPPVFLHYTVLFCQYDTIRCFGISLYGRTKKKRLARSVKPTNRKAAKTFYRKAHSGGREGMGGLGKESAEGKPLINVECEEWNLELQRSCKISTFNFPNSTFKTTPLFTLKTPNYLNGCPFAYRAIQKCTEKKKSRLIKLYRNANIIHYSFFTIHYSFFCVLPTRVFRTKSAFFHIFL